MQNYVTAGHAGKPYGFVVTPVVGVGMVLVQTGVAVGDWRLARALQAALRAAQ